MEKYAQRSGLAEMVIFYNCPPATEGVEKLKFKLIPKSQMEFGQGRY